MSKYNYKKEDVLKQMIPNTKYANHIDIKWLKQLFDFQTPTGNKQAQANYFDFIKEHFIDYYNIKCDIVKDHYGNIYITKGNSTNYQCVVSHIDTVHDFDENFKSVQAGDYIIGVSKGEQCGLGADPKCGVYILLELLIRTDDIKCVLFLDEEIGMCGSRKANMKFFRDCSFVMQFDRRSYSNDVIEHTNGIQTLNEEFKTLIYPIMLDFNYDFNYGTATDIGQLKNNDLKINAMNISNGSVDEHMDNEKCSIPHLLNALNFGIDIIQRLKNVNIPFINEKKVFIDKIKPSKNNDGYYLDGAWKQPALSLDNDWEFDQASSLERENEDVSVIVDKYMKEVLDDGCCDYCEMYDVIMDIDDITKKCFHCGIEYDMSNFTKHKKINS